MFTGIVETAARITALDDSGRVRIATGFGGLVLGESIAVNGVCLTVTEFDGNGEALFYMSPETLRCTALGGLSTGRKVNLERALQSGARLSGHWVQGHVDVTAALLSVHEEGESRRMEFALPAGAYRYCVEKGSIAIDGISLTVNEVSRPAAGTADGQSLISVQIIPHTWTHTTLGDLKPGDRVNVEYDILAKYVERLCQPYPKL